MSIENTEYSPQKDAKVNKAAESNAKLLAEHSTFRVAKEHVAVQMSPRSAESKKFAPTIKEKIILGLNANPDYKLLLEALVKPEYEKQTNFIKDEMKALRKGAQNPDAKAYLAWLEKNYEKVGNIDNTKEFIERSINLYISDEKFDINPETGAPSKKKQ